MPVRTDVGLEVAVWSEKQSSQVRSIAADALGKLGEPKFGRAGMIEDAARLPLLL